MEILQVVSTAARDARVLLGAHHHLTRQKLWLTCYTKEAKLDSRRSMFKDRSHRRTRMRHLLNLQYSTQMKKWAQYLLIAYPNTATIWLVFMKIATNHQRAKIIKFKMKLISMLRSAAKDLRYLRTIVIVLISWNLSNSINLQTRHQPRVTSQTIEDYQQIDHKENHIQWLMTKNSKLWVTKTQIAS